MMSRAVRRLVLDPFPLWQTGLSLFLWLGVGAMTMLWGWKVHTPSLTMVFAPAALSMSFVTKVRTWQTLPVSRSDLGLAQWGYMWGRSLCLAFIVTAVAVALDQGFGWLHAGWADIGAYFGGEITLIVLAGLMVPISGIARPLIGQGGAGMATLVLALVALGLAFHWSLDGTVSMFRAQMVTGGLMSMALMLVALPLSRWIPLAELRTISVGKATRGAAAPARARGNGARPASAFSLTAFIFGRLARIVPFFALVIGLLALVTTKGVMKDIMPAEVWLQFMPFFGGVSAMAITATVSQRVLAGLPLTALQRTVALHGVSPLLQAPLLVLTLAAGAVLRPAGFAGAWPMTVGLMSLGSIFMSAIALPMFLRFGQKAPFLFIGVAAGPLGAVTGMSTATAMNAGHGLGPIQGLEILVLAAFFAILVPVAWVWTWLELAYGRAAYRQRLTAFTTWRGQ